MSLIGNGKPGVSNLRFRRLAILLSLTVRLFVTSRVPFNALGCLTSCLICAYLILLSTITQTGFVIKEAQAVLAVLRVLDAGMPEIAQQSDDE